MRKCRTKVGNTSLVALAPLLCAREIIQGIEMHIMQDIEKVALTLDRHLFCASTEQWAMATMPLIEITRVTTHFL